MTGRRERVRVLRGPISWSLRVPYVGGPRDGEFAPAHAHPRHSPAGQSVPADTDQPHYLLDRDRRFRWRTPMSEPLDADEAEELTPAQLAALVRRRRFTPATDVPDDPDHPQALIRDVPRRR